MARTAQPGGNQAVDDLPRRDQPGAEPHGDLRRSAATS